MTVVLAVKSGLIAGLHKSYEMKTMLVSNMIESYRPSSSTREQTTKTPLKAQIEWIRIVRRHQRQSKRQRRRWRRKLNEFVSFVVIDDGSNEKDATACAKWMISYRLRNRRRRGRQRRRRRHNNYLILSAAFSSTMERTTKTPPQAQWRHPYRTTLPI